MIVGEESLLEVAKLALSAQRRGERFVEFEIEAQTCSAKYVRLWGGMKGDVVGKVFAPSTEPPNPDMPPKPATVTHLRVRADVLDILSTARRALETEPRSSMDRFRAWDIDGSR